MGITQIQSSQIAGGGGGGTNNSSVAGANGRIVIQY